jgi:hypothetical protein
MNSNIISEDHLADLESVTKCKIHTMTDSFKSAGRHDGRSSSDSPTWYRQFLDKYCCPETKTDFGSEKFVIGFLPAKKEYIKIYAKPDTNYKVTLGEASTNLMMSRGKDLQVQLGEKEPKVVLDEDDEFEYDVTRPELTNLMKIGPDVMTFIKKQKMRTLGFLMNHKYSWINKPVYTTNTHVCFSMLEGWSSMTEDDFLKPDLLRRNLGLPYLPVLSDVFKDILEKMASLHKDTQFELSAEDNEVYEVLSRYKRYRNGDQGSRERLYKINGMCTSFNDLIPANFAKRTDPTGKILEWKWINEHDIRQRPPSMFFELTGGPTFDFSNLKITLDSISDKDLKEVQCFVDDGDDVHVIRDNTILPKS